MSGDGKDEGEAGTGGEAATLVAGAIEAGDWEKADRSMDVLVEEIVEALIEGRDRDIEAMARLTERAYAGLVAVGDGLPLVDERVAAGQLRAVTALLAVALRHRRAPGTDPADDRNRAVLAAFPHPGEWLTLGEVADRSGLPREEVADRLPRLRAAGLIASRKAGRVTLHGLLEQPAEGSSMG